MSAIQQVASDCFARYGERTAVSFGRRRLSYAELCAGSNAVGTALRRALPVGGRVGLYSKNCPEYLSAYFGALGEGLVPFLLDANFNTAELASIRADCGIDALVLEEGAECPVLGAGASAPQPLATGLSLVRFDEERASHPPLRSTTEVCRFTSGTTGRPKCLEFSGTAVVSAARNWVAGTGLSAEDRSLCLAALSNGLAFNTSLLSTLLVGAELHLFAGMPLTRSVATLIAQQRITRLVAFPTLYRLMVADDATKPELLESLRIALSAGAPLWPDVREAFVSRFGLDISDYYGIAETGPCTFEPERGRGGGLGRPLPGVELRIQDGNGSFARGVGEVMVRSASMSSGYLNHPGLLECRIDAEGFYASGDTGHLTAERLHLVGRTQDHINAGGRKVDPTEVLDVVTKVAGVSEAVVFADTDAHRETIVHLVVVVADASDPTPKTLLDACRSRLAAYKVPGRISFVNAIPKNGIGKPKIAALRSKLNELSSTNE